MLAKRKMSVTDVVEKVGITMENGSVVENKQGALITPYNTRLERTRR
jgi:hypothetical protein